MVNIAGILLGAGESKRYGGNKLLSPHQTGQSLIGHSAVQLRQLVEQRKLSSFHIVTGRWHNEIEFELSDMKSQLLYNDQWQHGLASSIRVGVREALAHDNSISHVMITLADLALVTSGSLCALIDRVYGCPDTLVFSQWGEQMTVPAIFPRHCFQALLELEGDKGAKGIIAQLHKHKQAIGVNHPEAQLDIDTKVDWERYFETTKL